MAERDAGPGRPLIRVGRAQEWRKVSGMDVLVLFICFFSFFFSPSCICRGGKRKEPFPAAKLHQDQNMGAGHMMTPSRPNVGEQVLRVSLEWVSKGNS